ncbi:MAG: hypothetical protein QOI47_2412 [Actinomycetota bacterium]|nr:hypothetical protein [Actinomycetota bacterium]
MLVPVYNAAEFVESTIASVLEQTWTDLECIVIDDGSDVGTPDVLRTFGGAIRVVRQPNAGVAAARNRGVSEASGSLVAFLDADDLWRPTKLARQVAVADARPDAGLVYTGFSIVDEQLRARCDILPTPWAERVIGVVSLSTYGIGFGATALIPRRVLDQIGPFDERFSMAADAEYVWRLSRRFDGVGINEALVLYRQHAGQMHADLPTFEHDMSLLIDDARRDGLDDATWRTGRANLETRLSFMSAAQRSPRAALTHAARALQRKPGCFVALPIDAIRRRVARRVIRRWPLRPRSHPSIVA